MKVVLLSNDVVPEMNVPGTAPGIRVSGLAQGLRCHGIDTIVVVPRGRYQTVWSEMGAPGIAHVPSGVVVLRNEHISSFLDIEKPDATIICNSNQYDYIGDASTGRLIFDFFAPKILEAKCEGVDEATIRHLRERKLRALCASGEVIVNGRKKLGYVAEHLRECGREDLIDRIRVINMCYDWPANTSGPPTAETFSALVSGNMQRWLDYGTMFENLLEALNGAPTLSLTFNILRFEEQLERNRAAKACLAHPRARVRGAMLFDDYAGMAQRHDVFIDVFEPSEERHLAMVTRSVTALGLGLPIIHPDFTEVSHFVKDADAGWLLNSNSGADTAIDLLKRLCSDPGEVAIKAEGAARLSSGAFSPGVSVRPLVELLEDT